MLRLTQKETTDYGLKFLSLDQRHLWYLTGLLIADGHMALMPSGKHRVSWFSTDRQILDDIKDTIAFPFDVKERKAQKEHWKPCYSLGMVNSEIAQYFTEIGLCERKSHFQGPIKLNPKYSSHFIRGLIDGDGCIHQRAEGGLVLTLVGAAPLFMRWALHLFRQFGDFRINENASNRKNTLYRISAGGANAMPLLKHIYSEPGLMMARKREKARLFGV